MVKYFFENQLCLAHIEALSDQSFFPHKTRCNISFRNLYKPLIRIFVPVLELLCQCLPLCHVAGQPVSTVWFVNPTKRLISMETREANYNAIIFLLFLNSYRSIKKSEAEKEQITALSWFPLNIFTHPTFFQFFLRNIAGSVKFSLMPHNIPYSMH